MHLKYRPSTLDEIIGLDYIKKSLANYEFDSPVMFIGTKGSGKTTLALILAKMFVDESLNIRTVNCGDHTGIEDAREEVKGLRTTSLFGQKKVLVLDEIHRLTNQAQQVWLTELETLPKNVLVFACTTDPQKVVATLLRRFRQYQVNGLSNEEAKNLIDSVLKKEDKKIPKWIKIKIIEKSDGIPGLILTALPKVIGIEDEAEVDKLLETVKMQQDDEALDILKYIINYMGWSTVRNSLLGLLKSNSPETIRISLLNLISVRMTSNYTDISESRKLSKFFDILIEENSYPEKACLINKVFKGCLLFE